MTSPTPKFLFYGRRKGKPLRRRHSGLMESFLPTVALDLAEPLAGLGERRWLEIGFGGGEHLAHQAALHPEMSFIGAEAFLNGVAKLLAHLEDQKAANVRVFYGDARDLLEALPDRSLERIYLLYPDPWPKERQKKRRFVSAATLAQFHRLLQDGGLFLFASDIPDYVAWTREHATAHGGFGEEGDPAQPYENWVQTRYEAKALREGRTPAYLTFRKR
ncbi:tRNA (guanine(46)-N(7))-methyltransferase TrmB [Aestuariivirga sp.]|uniref:tRNA (guanine(46)-N(7))-methyltransferase TrmB n=1 Tax=Aestuariivirga sp. TaxID=2650926 RepID=UPI0039E4DF16